jgi:hypothetical protein
MQYKCPVRKACKCIFVCTYDRKEGKDFNFTPSCFVEKKQTPSKREKSPAKKVKRVAKKAPVKPVIASLVTVYPPLPKKPNIWDDI